MSETGEGNQQGGSDGGKWSVPVVEAVEIWINVKEKGG